MDIFDGKFAILENLQIKFVGVYEHMEWMVKNDGLSVQIDNTIIEDVQVSTVFVCNTVYIGWFFETMVFGGELDDHAFKSKTLGEAKNTHWKIVHAIRTNSTSDI